MDNTEKQEKTIKVDVRYYNIVADMVGRREEQWNLPAAATVGDLLSRIAEKYPAFGGFAQGPDLALRGPLRLFVNGRFVSDIQENLADGDQVRVFPVISGG